MSRPLRADSYKLFVKEHPEFETDKGLRSEVQHLLEGNEALDLETAYWAAKGKQARITAAKAKGRPVKQLVGQPRRQPSQGTGTARRGVTRGKPTRGDLRTASAADILAMAQAMHRR